MKDFHDLIFISRQSNLVNVNKLNEEINNVFHHRNTEKLLPINFSEEDYLKLQKMWASHLRSLGETEKLLQLPNHIKELVGEFNSWLTQFVI